MNLTKQLTFCKQQQLHYNNIECPTEILKGCLVIRKIKVVTKPAHCKHRLEGDRETKLN